MAAIELMTWVSGQKRWLKNYKGKMHAVSPRQLGVEPTKEASRLAANDWWTKKQTEIDATTNTRKHSADLLEHYNFALKNHRIYAKWHRKYGSLEKARKSETVIEWLQEVLKRIDPPFPLSHWQEDPTHEETVGDPIMWHVWQERRQLIIREERAGEQTPSENTIRAHIDQHLKTKLALRKGTIGTHQTYKERLTVFRTWVEPCAYHRNQRSSMGAILCLLGCSGHRGKNNPVHESKRADGRTQFYQESVGKASD